MKAARGHVRPRGGMLEAVLKLPGGKKLTRSTGFRVGQEAEAARFLEVLLAELGGAPLPEQPGSLTVRAWGERWAAERAARGIVSADIERSALRYHLFPQLGDVPIASLTKARMLEWVRTLPTRPKVDSQEPLAPRTVHHVAGTVRRMLAEAVDRELLVANPCMWRAKRDLPAKRDKVIGKRNRSGFAGWEVWQLLHDDRIPLDRRVMYGIDFLTGMRPGEVAARRWRDLDTTTAPLWRLDVGTAFDTRHGREKTTKTNVEKIIPVHPMLAELLRRWYAEGWRDFMGRAPTPDDLVVPREGGGSRPNGNSYKAFKSDLKRLGLREGRSHYESRSTFRSLAMAGGAPRAELDLITHPSPREAADLYTRLEVVWPAMCRAVEAVQVAPRRDDEAAPSGEVAEGVAVSDPEKEKARRLSGFGPSTTVSAEGIEPSTYGLRVHCSAS